MNTVNLLTGFSGDREPHHEDVRELTMLLLKAKRDKELTVGWQRELKLYTLHHTNSNTLECLRTPPKHFSVYFISLEFNDSHNAHLWSHGDEQNFKSK